MKSTHNEVVLKLRVAEKRVAADGVVTLLLRDPRGSDLPEWQPGAHIDLLLRPDLTRQYSLCGDPGDRKQWRVGILREVVGRGGSHYVHDKLEQGSLITVRGPRNHFSLHASPNYLFIAGGIGITPIVPMLAQAQRAGATWRLVYGGRTRRSMAFADELTARYGDRITLSPQDEFGLLDLDALLGEPCTHTLVYCCGPGPLLDAVEQHCLLWPHGALQVERFSPKQLDEPVSSERFEVELAQSGRTLVVPPDRSILQVLEEAGVPILSSCQEGMCGTCETSVLKGIPEHRDSLLTPDEQEQNNTMFVCVSRSRTPRLVLDL